MVASLEINIKGVREWEKGNGYILMQDLEIG
jgi:hypothetical protein